MDVQKIRPLKLENIMILSYKYNCDIFFQMYHIVIVSGLSIYRSFNIIITITQYTYINTWSNNYGKFGLAQVLCVQKSIRTFLR